MSNALSCKVIIIGESNAGKTCIIKTFIESSSVSNVEATVNATYYNKVLDFGNKKRVSFDVWDTNGHEKFRTLTKLFYTNAAVGILVYDVTNKNSFNEIKNFWYDELKKNGDENIVIAIVGNKIDKFYEEEVTENEGREYANSVGAIFQLTSCVKNQGIQELFKQCGEKYLDIYKDCFAEKEQNQTIILKHGKNVRKTVKKKRRKC